MRRLLRILATLLLALAVLLALFVLAVWIRHGGGARFDDRTGPPLIPFAAVERVVDLELPPGNVAVSAQGRVFFSFHPEARPAIKVVELVDGKPVPYPSRQWQSPGGGLPGFQSVLSLRIDRQGRLWALDYAHHGTGQPRLLAFDLARDELVHMVDFPAEVAPLGSHLNDFQVDPDGRRVYIADASIFGKRPALVVYDVERRQSRRLLEGHASVTAEDYVPVVQGVEMLVFGIFAVRPGVDSIALDRAGEWLYFAPVTSRRLYRVRARDLADESLAPEALAARVESFADKTMSDGMSSDDAGNLYLAEPEHSSIVRIAPDGALTTLVKDERLRWPDGLGFGPDGWLYVTCSALHRVIMKPAREVRANAPYQIFRFRPGVSAAAGH